MIFICHRELITTNLCIMNKMCKHWVLKNRMIDEREHFSVPTVDWLTLFFNILLSEQSWAQDSRFCRTGGVFVLSWTKGSCDHQSWAQDSRSSRTGGVCVLSWAKGSCNHQSWAQDSRSCRTGGVFVLSWTKGSCDHQSWAQDSRSCRTGGVFILSWTKGSCDHQSWAQDRRRFYPVLDEGILWSS